MKSEIKNLDQEHDQEALTILPFYFAFKWTMQQFQECSPLPQKSNMKGKRILC